MELELSLYRYAIPFTEPITVKQQRLVMRDGLVLALTSATEAVTAFGEIAPLFGLHSETLEQAEAQLVTLFATPHTTLARIMEAQFYPSVRTGLEMAIHNFTAARSGALPRFGTTPHNAEQVPVNALLFGASNEVVERAERLFTAGYRTFKLKVNAANSANAIASIQALHSRFGNAIALRLDANQSFTLNDAIAFGKALPDGSIAYIEEPLQNAERIGDFYAATAIPAALDETLWQNPALLDIIPTKALAALVLKPNRLGGITVAEKFARYAAERGLLAVVSSAFESGISLGFYAWLAASCNAEPAACGLDTSRYLAFDVLTTPFPTNTPLLDAAQCYRNSLQVNLATLKPCAMPQSFRILMEN
uniref:o-succinylbenzoate synthase n=1 Tax=Chlorobium chlorochromatii (strain CaD3) TaxID=340177 RepID=Q3APV6_CHLCH